MKRSNFLASIAAIFLAPFGIKTKPEYVNLNRDWSNELLFDKSEIEATVTLQETAITPRNIVENPRFSIPFPPVPKDGKPHDVIVKYDCGDITYFIDGKQVTS